MIRPAARRLSLVLCAVALTSCTVGPDYRPPAVESGDGWAEPAVERSPDARSAPDGPDEVLEPKEPVALDRWWRSLGDPTLARLVEGALEHNLDVRRATVRIAEARALLDAAAGGDAPIVRTDAHVNQQRLSEEGLLPVEQIPGFDRDLTIYDVGFDATWELDLFGRTRRTLEAAAAQVGEAVELRRGARMRVAAEVARTYLELRGAQRRRTAVKRSVEAARRTRDLVELQVEAGEVAAARLAQVDTDLTALEARIPVVDGEIRAAALALGVLTGGLPESELGLLEGDSDRAPDPPGPVPLPALPVGERVDLLRRRPDVRAAERRLAAATARIGVATAELFPRLSISAAGGFQAMSPADLLSAGSETWSLVPLISWRVFDGGRVRAEIRAAEARTEAAALGYEQAVREALGDAERALTRYRHGLDALDRQTAAVEAAERNREYARLRHEAGETPLFELLDADRSLARAQETHARTRTDVATTLVALFKALGGGWRHPTPSSTPSLEPIQPPSDLGAS